MKILILTLYYEPDIGANAVIITELAKEFARKGHQITVVTGFPHYADNVLERKYRGKLFARESSAGITVIRTYLYTSKQKAKFLVRFLNYVSFNILSTLAALFSGQQDLIMAPSPPLTIGLSAAVVGFLKRIPYLYNVQDINPDVLIKLGILKNRVFIRFSQWLERFVYRHASQISILSDGFKRNLLEKDVPADKLTVVPNFIDPDYLKPLPKENHFTETHQLGGKFVILYAGNLGHSQNLEHLLLSAESLKERSDIAFVIVGNGSRKPFLEEFSRELALENVLFLPFQPWEDVPYIYAAADLALVTLKKDIALDSVPSKIYSIMASARPILAAVDPGSDAWSLIEGADCGVCLPPEDPQALTEAILALQPNHQRCLEMGDNGRRFVVGQFTKDKVSEAYLQLFTRMIDGKR